MKKLALIGNDTKGSLSPKLMTFFANKVGVELSYSLINLPTDCSEQLLLDTIYRYDGVNVTSPFKQRVGNFLGIPTANTVVKRDSGLFACSTDGFGVCLSLAYHNLDVYDKNILIIGAGGSAYSTASALNVEGARIKIINRTQEKADNMEKELKLKPFCGQTINGILSFIPAQILFGVTEEQIKAANFCFDANYKQPSPLLKNAKNYGVTAVNGLSMLFYQGVASFGLFCNVAIPSDQIDLWYKEFYNEITNN